MFRSPSHCPCRRTTRKHARNATVFSARLCCARTIDVRFHGMAQAAALQFAAAHRAVSFIGELAMRPAAALQRVLFPYTGCSLAAHARLIPVFVFKRIGSAGFVRSKNRRSAICAAKRRDGNAIQDSGAPPGPFRHRSVGVMRLLPATTAAPGGPAPAPTRSRFPDILEHRHDSQLELRPRRRHKRIRSRS
jgi:hypothetical protein